MRISLAILSVLATALPALAQQPPTRQLQLLDAFELEYVRHPAISPDGQTVAYERVGFDIMTDRPVSDIYTVGFDGSANLPLVTGASNPVWSPDGQRLAYTKSVEGKSQIHVYHFVPGRVGVHQQITRLRKSPSSMTWSPDGDAV